jgi:hypothetical protein
MTVTKGAATKSRADANAPKAPVRTATPNRRFDTSSAIKFIVLLIALAAAGYIAWILVTSAGLGTFPTPAGSASDAAKVGSFMIRFGLVIIALAAAVGLGAQILGLALGNQTLRSGDFDWVEFMKALAELIKTPAGMGFGVTILGVILVFPTVFATP